MSEKLHQRQDDVDGRDKPGHDGGRGWHRRFFRIAVSLAFVLIVMTTAFAGWVALFYLLQWRRKESGLPSLLIYLVTFIVILLPWMVWTRWVLQIPSDLIAQNFSGPGTELAWASPMNFIWIRVYNLFFTHPSGPQRIALAREWERLRR